MSNLNRFSLIAAEETELENACPVCGKPMEENIFFRAMDMDYCEICEKFRPRGKNVKNRTPRKDTSL